MLDNIKNFNAFKPNHAHEDVHEIFTETTKLIREFNTNRLVNDFIHDVNKRLSNKRFYSRMDKPYFIDSYKYTEEEIKEFLFVFMGKFPFHMYKPYNVFPIGNGYIKVYFQIDDYDKLITIKTKNK